MTGVMTAAARLRRLTLTNFRSYHAAKIEAGAGTYWKRK